MASDPELISGLPVRSENEILMCQAMYYSGRAQHHLEKAQVNPRVVAPGFAGVLDGLYYYARLHLSERCLRRSDQLRTLASQCLDLTAESERFLQEQWR